MKDCDYCGMPNSPADRCSSCGAPLYELDLGAFTKRGLGRTLATPPSAILFSGRLSGGAGGAGSSNAAYDAKPDWYIAGLAHHELTEAERIARYADMAQAQHLRVVDSMVKYPPTPPTRPQPWYKRLLRFFVDTRFFAR